MAEENLLGPREKVKDVLVLATVCDEAEVQSHVRPRATTVVGLFVWGLCYTGHVSGLSVTTPR